MLQPPVDKSALHALGNVAVSGASGAAVGLVLYGVAFRPALRRCEALIDVAQKTSVELRAVLDAWNALDAPSQNAVKMQARKSGMMRFCADESASRRRRQFVATTRCACTTADVYVVHHAFANAARTAAGTAHDAGAGV